MTTQEPYAYGYTHKGTDGQTRARLRKRDNIVEIEEDTYSIPRKWMECRPWVKEYFTPDEPVSKDKEQDCLRD